MPLHNEERAAHGRATPSNLRLATPAEDSAKGLGEQAREAEALAREYLRTGLLLSGVAGRQARDLANHYSAVQRAMLREALNA